MATSAIQLKRQENRYGNGAEDDNADNDSCQQQKLIRNRERLIRLMVQLDGKYAACALFDPGASRDFVDATWVKKKGLKVYDDDAFEADLADGTSKRCQGYIEMSLTIGDYHAKNRRFFLFDMDGNRQQIMLGKPWCFDEMPEPNWRWNHIDIWKSGLRFRLRGIDNEEEDNAVNVVYVSRRELITSTKRAGDQAEIYAIMLTNVDS